MRNKYLPVAFLITLLSLSGGANAALVTTDITAAITDAATASGVVGLAVVVMIVGIKVFKWLRRAL
ncbi:MAG: major capsid protein [Burkholderiales bacterium]